MFWSTVPYSTLTASDVACLLTLLLSSRFSPAAARRVPAFEDLCDSHWVTRTIQDNLPISRSSVGHICKVQVATYGATFTGPRGRDGGVSGDRYSAYCTFHQHPNGASGSTACWASGRASGPGPPIRYARPGLHRSPAALFRQRLGSQVFSSVRPEFSPLQHWCLGWDNFLLCLAASLASTHEMLAAPPPPHHDNQKTFPDIAKYPFGVQNRPVEDYRRYSPG